MQLEAENRNNFFKHSHMTPSVFRLLKLNTSKH